MRPFEQLSTEKFRLHMRPHAEVIYQQLFPSCRIEDLRKEGIKVHALDQAFGIDTLAKFPTGQWVSIQEKYRKNEYLVERRLRLLDECPDFTQEFKNGDGTDGEWFHLGAQMYFYGWADERAAGFERWVLLDIAKYKLVVEQAGGLSKIGVDKKNRMHGGAVFYCIPIDRLRDAWVMDSESFKRGERNGCINGNTQETSQGS